MRALLLALFLALPLHAQELPQATPGQCLLSVLNLTEVLTFRVGLVHGEVSRQYPDQIEPGHRLTIRVPCGSDVPVQLIVINVVMESDFLVREFDVPLPGTVTVWCLGRACKILAKTMALDSVGSFQPGG